MSTEHTAIIIDIERYLKIERINRFLATKRVTLTFTNGNMTFPISFIDEQAHVFGEVDNFGYRVELSESQLAAIYNMVVREEAQS